MKNFPGDSCSHSGSHLYYVIFQTKASLYVTFSFKVLETNESCHMKFDLVGMWSLCFLDPKLCQHGDMDKYRENLRVT